MCSRHTPNLKVLVSHAGSVLKVASVAHIIESLSLIKLLHGAQRILVEVMVGIELGTGVVGLLGLTVALVEVLCHERRLLLLLLMVHRSNVGLDTRHVLHGLSRMLLMTMVSFVLTVNIFLTTDWVESEVGKSSADLGHDTATASSVADTTVSHTTGCTRKGGHKVRAH